MKTAACQSQTSNVATQYFTGRAAQNVPKENVPVV
jgi:hypothetical protein